MRMRVSLTEYLALVVLPRCVVLAEEIRKPSVCGSAWSGGAASALRESARWRF
jgi:hypothetical protein